MNDLDREIYELGEMEREAERGAQWHRPGSIFHRLLLWCARYLRRERQELQTIKREGRHDHW